MTASGPERDALASPDYVKLLSAGINVVTTSTRLAPDVAPDWPTLPNALGYRVVIAGTPDIDCTVDATLRDRRKAGI